MDAGTRDLPVPPPELWLGYGATAEEYLASGVEHVRAMAAALESTGFALDDARRILDLGVGAGRMIRCLRHLAADREVWGTDIDCANVTWCKQHLSPPFRFATTTLVPHLPFEDRAFDLIYAGSVFTHIDDLADSWLLELCRVVRPGGRVYLTIHDQATIDILLHSGQRFALGDYLLSVPEFRQYCLAPFGKFTIGRAAASQVFYHADFFAEEMQSAGFQVLAMNRAAYGYQTAVIAERR